jgi:heptosyltransferase-1
MNVLVVRLSAMGDVIHALPLAANLRRAGHTVGWIAEKPFAALLAGNPNVSRVFTVETRRWRRRPWGRQVRGQIRALRRDLASFGADFVLDPQSNQKSWWVCRLSPGERIVLEDRQVRKDATRRMSRLRVFPSDSTVHVSARALALLEPLRVPVRGTAPDARYLIAQSSPAAGEFLARQARPFALYHPGAGWGNKAWGEERFARLADRLLRSSGIQPIVSWGPGDEARADSLAETLGAPKIPASDFADLARIISEARFFAAGDTGPLHLADALGVPTIGLFGPTDPARNGPSGREGLTFFAALPCAPCLRRYGETKPCLTAIDPDAVAEAVQRWLPER